MENSIFINRLLNLLLKRNITKNKLLNDLNLSKNSFVDWSKRGTIPNGITLSKLSKYFNVSVDYLIGNSNRTNSNDPQKNQKEIMFALFESEDVTEDMFEDVKRYAKYVKQKHDANNKRKPKV